MIEYVLVVIVGFFVGSFLNVVIDRLQAGQSFVRGRSRCDYCRTMLRWFELVPVLSFLVLRGQCRTCKKKITVQHVLLELVTGLAFAAAYYYTQDSFPTSQFWLVRQDLFNVFILLQAFVYVSGLVLIFVYDLKYYLILDKVSLPLLGFAFITEIALHPTLEHVTALAWGALLGGGFFLLQFIISRGRWIGGGDIRLGALLGVMLGWPQVAVAVFIAYILGALVGIGLLLSGKKQMGSQIPFGTFLTFAAVITFIWGHSLVTWYLAL